MLFLKQRTGQTLVIHEIKPSKVKHPRIEVHTKVPCGRAESWAGRGSDTMRGPRVYKSWSVSH